MNSSSSTITSGKPAPTGATPAATPTAAPVVAPTPPGDSKDKDKLLTGYVAGAAMFALATALQITYIMSFPGTGSKKGDDGEKMPLVLQDDNKTELTSKEKASLLFAANLFWFLGIVLMALWSKPSPAYDQHPMIVFAYVVAALGAFMMMMAALVKACGG